jgi:hypothetical protein
MGTGTLTGYQVTVTDTVTGVIYPYSLILAPATLLGLPNGHTMSVEIRTVTTDGVSAGATAFVTPAEYPPATTPPDAPTGGVVTAYADGLGLSWTAPAVVGTYPIADYVIRASSASGGQFDHWYVSATTSANIGGLGTDQDWSIDIWSRSMAGQSLASLLLTGHPISSAAPTPTPSSSYAAAPPITDPGTNPVYWGGYQPPIPVDVTNPDTPPPPPGTSTRRTSSPSTL